ncbi:hypothetical protein A2U01_0010861 [Trifolium medium]|uniref:Uncharacterized protein n=1 Tax=Trifolium medium TaxID=97028 RepID=A0A392MQW8_9FABA|nr:hypothetical protein [Trifolium medium]
MSLLCEVLSQICANPWYDDTFIQGSMKFNGCDIEETRGLDMEGSFTSNLPGTLNENRVRMRAAMTILVGQHNELRHELMLKAMEHWDTLLFK